MQTGRIVSHLAFGCAYFVIASASIVMTRFDGGVAFVWCASALLIARIYSLPSRDWIWSAFACGVASFLATGLFGLGWAAALPMAAINIGEAIFAALILTGSLRFKRADSLSWMVTLLVAAVASAALGAIGAGIVAKIVAGNDIGSTALAWLIGHSLGVLTYFPLFAQAFIGGVKAWWEDQPRGSLGSAAIMLLAMTGLTFVTFYQDQLPLLFLPLLPLVLITYRLGHFGAALGMIILVSIGSVATLRGHGPVFLANLDFIGRVHILQFYFAGAVLTVLPLAAALARRDSLFQQLEESEARYRMLAEHSTDIIVNLDKMGNFRFVSPALDRCSGHSADAMIGRSPLEIIDPAFHEAVKAAHYETLAAGGGTIRVEYLATMKSGDQRWFETHQRATFDENGQASGIVGYIRDIHERKMLETQLAVDASTDELTGAFNRRALVTALDDATSQHMHGALAVLDLDHFKGINDKHGHDVGDAALRMFARVARETIRSNDIFARIGGEEFALFLPGASIEQARKVCQRLLDSFSAEEIGTVNGTFRATASAGISPLKPSWQETMKRADTALYFAKKSGRDQLSIAA